ncbi:prolipoprotein diacylglyceryl transferase [bacterium]|nr:prolipoprotein diacylglyceryl transferase [bacterium]
MHPILFDFGPFSLHSYGLMMAIAFALGIWIATRRAPQRGIEAKFILDMAVLTLIFSLVGARATYVFTHLDEFRGHWIDTISPIQSDGKIGIAGLVLLGGVVAGFAAAYVIAKRKRVGFLTITDILIPSLALGIGIGRIGCFLNGCCPGSPGECTWCMVFPEESLTGSIYPHIHVHPTQLYETVAMFCVFGFLLWFDRKPRPLGMLTGLFLVLYGVWRFYLEGLRWYEEGMIVTNIGDMRITVSRVISAAMVIAGVFLYLKVKNKPPVEKIKP